METNTKERKIPTFGKIMLASGVGTLIVLLLVGVFKLLVLFGLIGAVGSSKTVPTRDAFLKIDLTTPMDERSPSELNAMLSSSGEVGFADLLRAVAAAADDDNIKGLYLYMGGTFPFSWGKAEELRQSLAAFCESGKPVLAYADVFTQQGYFVASVADSIYLNPSGMVEFRGIGAEPMFYQELLDRLSVKMTLVRPKSNSYKSAGETYTMNHLSDANRTQIREYIKSIWDYAAEAVAEARDIDVARVNTLADNLDAFLAADAMRNGLIDRLCFENDVVNTMQEAYGSKKTARLVDYVKGIDRHAAVKERIAVIYAEGEVTTGDGVGTAVYADRVTKALDAAAADDNIKAIVLRVNSPGGMVTASEVMTDAVRRAKAKKPLVVSMGDVAASAGYEISCNADYIIAEPTTLTGSIGVFSTLPEVGGALKRHLGITTDTVNTNANSTSLSALRPLSPKALELMQRNVEDFYTVFVQRVADGRGLPYDYVDSIARGRVWTGRDALKLGLVDALGGLEDAILEASNRAGIDDYQVVDYPANENLLDELTKIKGGSSGIASMRGVGTPATPGTLRGDGVWVGGSQMAELLDRICETRGLQARVEFFLLTE